MLLQYLHSDGYTYTQTISVPAGRRVTAYPGSVPAGAFGCHVEVVSGPPIAAERMLYGGPNWTISHAGVGSTDVGTTWDFTEGANSWQFETYILLANPHLTIPASVTLTFTRTDGLVITSPVTVPAGGRVSVWTKGIIGLADTSFRTVVAVTSGPGIVAERATYWPLNTGGGVYGASAATSLGLEATTTPALGAPLTIPLATGADTNLPAVQTFNPYAATRNLGTAPRLYQNLLGYPTSKTTSSTGETVFDAGPAGGLVVSAAAVTEGAVSAALLGASGPARSGLLTSGHICAIPTG